MNIHTYKHFTDATIKGFIHDYEGKSNFFSARAN